MKSRKCESGGFGGRDGCFGDNNELIGKNSRMFHALVQIGEQLEPMAVSIFDRQAQALSDASAFLSRLSAFSPQQYTEFGASGRLLRAVNSALDDLRTAKDAISPPIDRIKELWRDHIR